MRGTHDPAGGRSATPIYDALYLEYLRSFRALPGDRSGEEHLTFASYGPVPVPVPVPVPYGMNFGNGRGGSYPEPQFVHSGPPPGSWYANGRQHNPEGNPLAALPPGRRREH
ncbi:hypothetical protein [Streptomyces sp. NPDC046821]|uniref:hypothetical protein n=1 Tax=Streptomyces sp. NPDC046821 TaxID=3154702 RepID=UPI0033D0DB1A